MDLRPGCRIERYELICPIANGGMGAVWLARVRRRNSFEKFFALKMVLPQHAADAQFRAMFLDEARISASIAHPNVASIIDMGEEAGLLFLAMEWVDGDSLQALHVALAKTGHRIPMGIVLRVIADACAGLHAVHEAKDRTGALLEIVHRDVSPHNILIDRQGQPKLIDFGIARARDRALESTTAGGLKGKVRYMAPEQPESASLDRRTDVWAMGAVLYVLLVGRAPYEASNEMGVLRRLMMGVPPDPPGGNIPTHVTNVVMKCLSVRREDRYPTAEALHGALEAAMRDTHISTTRADVAAFVGEQMRERALARGAKIEATLQELDRYPALTPTPVTPLLIVDPTPHTGPLRRPAPQTQIGVAPEADSAIVEVAGALDTHAGSVKARPSTTDDLTPSRRSRSRALVAIGVAVSFVGIALLGMKTTSGDKALALDSSVGSIVFLRAAAARPAPPRPSHRMSRRLPRPRPRPKHLASSSPSRRCPRLRRPDRRPSPHRARKA